jgi:DNA-directed RNA polymerase specialized sigma24 family protein
LERAVNRLEEEFTTREQRQLFDGLRSFLLGEHGDATYAQAAAGLGLTTAAMKMAVSRMRARCRELLREEIVQTVASAQEAEEEYRALIAAIRQ